MRLWIIGNGFDLYHGLKTSYYDYKEFLCKKNTCKRQDPIYQEHRDWIPQKLCPCCCRTDEVNVQDGHVCPVRRYNNLPRGKKRMDFELWQDLEEGFSVDFGKLVARIGVGEGENPNPSGEPLSAIKIHGELDFANVFTGKWLCEWLGEVEEKLFEAKKKFDPEKLLDVKPGDVIVTFNYTRTPQEFYDVPDNDVCYIHGSHKNAKQAVDGLDSVDRSGEGRVVHQNLVFGSPDSTVDSFLVAVECFCKEHNVPEVEKKYLQEKCTSLINQFCKKYDGGLDELVKLLERIRCKYLMLDEVVVAGHSLGRIDMPYFDRLATEFASKKWRFVYHSDKDITTARSFCEAKHLDALCVPWGSMRRPHFTVVIPTKTNYQ